MTTTPVDTGNRLLGPSPAELTLSTVMCPDGVRRGVITIRTPSTTLTAYLDKATMLRWGLDITATGERITSLVSGNGQQP